MLKLDNIFSRLNIMERTQLNSFIKAEVLRYTSEMKQALGEAAKEREEIITKENDKTWKIINDNITLALRENRVSPERINKVYARVQELTENNPDVRLMNVSEQPSKDFEILTKNEFMDLIEELLECNCKGCIKGNKDCNVYKLLKKHNIEVPTGYKRNCKYGY